VRDVPGGEPIAVVNAGAAVARPADRERPAERPLDVALAELAEQLTQRRGLAAEEVLGQPRRQPDGAAHQPGTECGERVRPGRTAQPRQALAGAERGAAE